jgi:hypothetical protein
VRDLLINGLERYVFFQFKCTIIFLTGPYFFPFLGSVQTFVVPENINEIDIELYGASGANYDQKGGLGGYIKVSRHVVTPGQLLYVYIGGLNSYNGGGPGTDYGGRVGGGASDVRTKIDDLTTRILVAGGGGGGRYFICLFAIIFIFFILSGFWILDSLRKTIISTVIICGINYLNIFRLVGLVLLLSIHPIKLVLLLIYTIYRCVFI